MSIKIISGFSEKGGSTFAHINATNYFNSKGLDTTLYGPHRFHLDKCKADLSQNFKLSSEDILIVHFRDLPFRPPVKKVILSLHEKDLYPLKQKNYKVFDKIHFLNQAQKDWHGVEHPHFFCPNFHTYLEKKTKTVSKIAGIIGSVDKNKQVHKSILRALEDGMDKVYIYGTVNDQQYFYESVKPLLDKYSNVILKGFLENKQEIYDSISDVYMSSNSENASFVADECFMTNTTFHGNDNVKGVSKILSNEEVFEIWKRELEC